MLYCEGAPLARRGAAPYHFDMEVMAYRSENFTFCRRWTSLGGDIWVDSQSKLTHVGPVAFAGNFSAKLTELPPE